MGTVTQGTTSWIETFTAGETWVCPSVASNGFDVTSIQFMEARGKGGSGGTGSSTNGGGGGGGGAYAKKTAAFAVTPGTSVCTGRR